MDLVLTTVNTTLDPRVTVFTTSDTIVLVQLFAEQLRSNSIGLTRELPPPSLVATETGWGSTCIVQGW